MLTLTRQHLKRIFKKKIDNWNKLPNQESVAKELIKLNKKEVEEFFKSLSKSVSRFIERVVILPLHGQESAKSSVVEAIDFLNDYSENPNNLPLTKYEITIKYNTGDRIDASFKDKKD
jgi:hypothetical protein